MQNEEIVYALLDTSTGNIITAQQVSNAGLHRSILQKLVENGELRQVGRGLYVRNDVWEDEMYILQRKYQRGIYSHETALYLHGFTDRTPAQYNMTFPKGYNSPSLKQEIISVTRVVPENYSLGMTDVTSPCGSPLRAYDLERTLCDILRGQGGDIQIITDAMKRYAAAKTKDIQKLMAYAEQLHVKPKVQRYMEVLL